MEKGESTYRTQEKRDARSRAALAGAQISTDGNASRPIIQSKESSPIALVKECTIFLRRQLGIIDEKETVLLKLVLLAQLL